MPLFVDVLQNNLRDRASFGPRFSSHSTSTEPEMYANDCEDGRRSHSGGGEGGGDKDVVIIYDDTLESQMSSDKSSCVTRTDLTST